MNLQKPKVSKMDSFLKHGRQQVTQNITDLLLLADSTAKCYNTLFVYGPSGSGKTTLVKECLNTVNFEFFYINCLETYSERLFYNSLSQAIDGSTAEIDNFSKLINLINNSIRQTVGPLFLVFDKAEFLRTLDSHIISCLFCLGEYFPSKNVCSILISELPFCKFMENISVREPIQIYIPPYAKEDIFRLLVEKSNSNCSHQLLNSFLHNTWAMLVSLCQNNTELVRICSELFPYYTQYTDPEVERPNSKKLLKILDSKLKDLLENKWNTNTFIPSNIHISSNLPLLSYYSKFILISAFIATNNQAKFDAKLFSTRSLKKYRTTTQKSKGHSSYIGNFDFERLLAIFYRISGEYIPFSTNLYTQIQTLISIGLLNQVNPANCGIYSPRFNSVLNYNSIDKICKSIPFELNDLMFN